jgi:hypothetical protein
MTYKSILAAIAAGVKTIGEFGKRQHEFKRPREWHIRSVKR